ncbi:uncharacterized protein AC631_01711 [Debaryomyces fabryi]|uniref:Uncharacterized protein n=1 Tax=Debaryomyces fabryi TaxID=58627 RepID=A0A0V1Q1Z8_9ASCO|nr:uncharacterized protein AC631_01711 [Debaryomyces fabryi]KSA02536.1 hypothetical protein AC631_01711 [Debaryomyces fabryi]CUM47722.1 unnamed protein product [Debaryomyces fabryi]
MDGKGETMGGIVVFLCSNIAIEWDLSRKKVRIDGVCDDEDLHENYSVRKSLKIDMLEIQNENIDLHGEEK